MPMKAFLSACMHGCLLLMIWEGLRVYNARKKRQMDILSGLSANGAVMEQCTGLLCEAAEPPSPCSVQPVAAGSHGPAAGAVSSFKLEAGWDKRSRGRRQRPGKVCPARSKPPCLLCTLPVPPPVRSPSLGCLRQALPGGFREASGKFPGNFLDT